MEELYQLIEERLVQIKTANEKFPMLDCPSDSTSDISSSSSGTDFRDLSQHLSQIKRLEKVRVFKENEMMESFYALKSFDVAQKKRFHERSYFFMKMIRPDFCYAKFKLSDEIKEVAKLYLNFFLHSNMQNKIEEIRKVYSSSKCAGHSFLFLLMKWLIELTRINLQNMLKDKLQKAAANPANKMDKPAGHPVVRGNLKGFSLTKSRSKSVSKQQSQSALFRLTTNTQNSPTNTNTNSQALKPQDPSLDQPIKFINLKPLRSREDIGHLMDSEEEKHVFHYRENTELEESSLKNKTTYEDTEHTFDGHPLRENFSMVQNTKNIKKTPFVYSIEGSSLQLFFPSNCQVNNYYSLLEDLEMSQGTFLYQIVLPRNPRKIKTGTFYQMDLDKRKEMMAKVYRDLYFRNLEVEKGINNFQTSLQNGGVLEYAVSPQPRKGESFCDNLTINFPKMFPHLILDEETSEALIKKNSQVRSSSPARNRKSSEKRSENAIKIMTVSKNGRSESNDTRSQRKSYMDISPVKTMSRFTDGEEFPNVVGPNPNFGFRTENRFRIMKKKMGIYHEVREYPHKSQRMKTIKMTTENSALLTQESLSQALTEVFNYYPKLRKEYENDSAPKSTMANTKEIKLPSYSICNGNRSVSISKVKSNQLGEFTIWDTLNQTRVVYPEKINKRQHNRSEHFNFMQTIDLNHFTGVTDHSRISPQSNRNEKAKKEKQ